MCGGGGDLYFLKWLIEMTTIMMTLSRQVQNGEYPDRTLLRKWWNNLNMKKKNVSNIINSGRFKENLNFQI